MRDEMLFDFGCKAQLTDAQIREKRLHFGLVFQSFNLFPQYSVLQNITLAVKLLQGVKRRQKQKLMEIEEMAKRAVGASGAVG